MKVLEGKKVEQIHQYLGLLADTGLGEIDEDGKSHSSVGFRAY
jgi:predicted transcriptional regulator